jgi:hypothetical protein
VERLAAYWDKHAGRYDREMDRWDRRLFGDERVSIPLAGEHFRRRPLTHVRELGFLIEETERLKLGIVERVCARKAKLAPLRSSVPETGIRRGA